MVRQTRFHQLSFADAEPIRSTADIKAALDALDAYGWREIYAIAPISIATLSLATAESTWASPTPYLCDDNTVEWTKVKAQLGLGGELIANRLAETLAVGPNTVIVRVDGFLRELGGSARAVGTEHIPGVISSKELNRLGAALPFDVTIVDSASRAATAVFQSWLDVMDQQVLIRREDGLVYSHDHGEVFRSLQYGPPRMVLAPIKGVHLDWTVTAAAALEMVARIDQLTTLDILRAVAGVPDEEGWFAPFRKRVEIARWLLYRRSLLAEEVAKWTRTVT